ncbi:MAG: menaquinone biosynthetic enzyme MqnA/MqnD family protein [Saprospiraceae bacterium]
MSLRVIAVDYANTLPLRSGLESMESSGALSMSLARPARATELFAKGEYQLGLLPAAAQLMAPGSIFVGDYGIVSDGFVGSVGIFSEVPFDEIELLYLDHDSRSSVLLTQILIKHHWRRGEGSAQPIKIVDATPGYREQLSGTAAGLIIGDPAIEARSKFPFYIDLAEAWKDMTGLPFVFAAWLASSPIDAPFVKAFDAAQAKGVQNRVSLAEEYQPFVPGYDLKAYFTSQIQYLITPEAREGLALFLELGAEILGQSHNEPDPVFS